MISYVPEADIPLIHYSVVRLRHKLPVNVTSRHQQRLVAALVDECRSKGNREGYLDDLKEHIPVHVYGKCGAPCPGTNEEDCLRYLSRFYKFILVFETEVCQHYLSPRLFRVLSATDMIPVVFGGVDYTKLFQAAFGGHKTRFIFEQYLLHNLCNFWQLFLSVQLVACYAQILFVNKTNQ